VAHHLVGERTLNTLPSWTHPSRGSRLALPEPPSESIILQQALVARVDARLPSNAAYMWLSPAEAERLQMAPFGVR
jgi:hypothetical protein